MGTPRIQLQRVLADALTYVLSGEVNKALSGVTADQLVQEAIDRNGTSLDSAAAQFDPYSIDYSQTPPASAQPVGRTSFASGSGSSGSTRIDRIRAVRRNLEATIREVKALPVDALESETVPASGTADSIFAGLDYEQVDSGLA